MAIAVTIARQYGSGGNVVGQEVARLLQAYYLDKEVIGLVAKRAGVAEQAVADRDERPIPRTERVLRLIEQNFARGFIGATEYIDYPLLESYTERPLPGREVDEKRYLELISGVMKDLAQADNVVIIGRGGNMILKGLPNVLRVLVIAPMEVRVRRVMEREHLSAQAATELMTRVDTERRAFVKQFFKVEWTDPIDYDLVINTGKCSFGLAAKLITEVASELEEAQHS